MIEVVNIFYLCMFLYIGILVLDFDVVVKFYIEVLGWYLIMKFIEIVEDDFVIGEMCIDVFGVGWDKFCIVYFLMGDCVGVEIFEFKNQENFENNFEYWKIGVFYFCV